MPIPTRTQLLEFAEIVAAQPMDAADNTSVSMTQVPMPLEVPHNDWRKAVAVCPAGSQHDPAERGTAAEFG